MPLIVFNVAYPLAPAGLGAVGGAEQVLTRLDTALTQAGHRSLVVGGRISLGQAMPFVQEIFRLRFAPLKMTSTHDITYCKLHRSGYGVIGAAPSAVIIHLIVHR